MDLAMQLAALTLEEKIALLSGSDQWHTQAVSRLCVLPIMVADGPHGLRKQDTEGDHLGIGTSMRSTCFPPAATSANSWDPDLLFAMGKAIGAEALQEGVSVVLGPGVNIKRSPLCGRNFEYFSEDPYLAGTLGSAWIRGLQSMGVGASLKHLAANNQERWRMLNDSLVDERALREIYLAAFEKAVKEAKPWTVMAAYNKLNGAYCAESLELLTGVLREEWGFDGLVISDWGAVNDPSLAVKAGMDLEMPASYGVSAAKIRQAVASGQLCVNILDQSVKRVLELVARGTAAKRPDFRYDPNQHHTLARKIAAESAVLLKNEAHLLPLDPVNKPAILGQFAVEPRYQGTGSSLINPTKLDHVLEQLESEGIAYSFAPGYALEHDEPLEHLLQEACLAAQGAKVAIVFAGLTARYESEGYDRSHLELPPSHNELIKRVAAVNPNTVVVLSAGAPVTMPWLGQVGAVLHSYLGGQAGAGAIVDLLFGKLNPSGKLAETYPIAVNDHLANEFFAYNREQTEYRESIFVGYRYYDAAQKEVLFPFGYGLSYTQFLYSDLELTSSKLTAGDILTVRCTIKNSGLRAGAEIIQLYVGKEESPLYRAPHELKGFCKVYLRAGEEKTVEFSLDYRSFAYYNTQAKAWHVEAGKYQIKIGPSSRELPLLGKVQMETVKADIQVPDYRERAPAYYKLADSETRLSREEFHVVYGQNIPELNIGSRYFHENSTLQDLAGTFLGKIVWNGTKRHLWKVTGAKDPDDPLWKMTWSMAQEMPLRSVVALSGGTVPDHFVQGLIRWANGERRGALKTWIWGQKRGRVS